MPLRALKTGLSDERTGSLPARALRRQQLEVGVPSTRCDAAGPHHSGETWVFGWPRARARIFGHLPEKFKAGFTLGLIFCRCSRCRKIFQFSSLAPERRTLSTERRSQPLDTPAVPP